MRARIAALFITTLLASALPCGAAPDEGRRPAQKHLEQGHQALANNDWEKAAAEFRTVTELEPKNSNAFRNLARAAARGGDLKKANELALHAISLNEKDPTAYSELGFILRELGDKKGAEMAERRAFELEAKRTRDRQLIVQNSTSPSSEAPRLYLQSNPFGTSPSWNSTVENTNSSSSSTGTSTGNSSGNTSAGTTNTIMAGGIALM